MISSVNLWITLVTNLKRSVRAQVTFAVVLLLSVSVCAGRVYCAPVPFGPANTVATGLASAICICAGDIDADGNMDLIGGAFDETPSTSKIVWYENRLKDGMAWVPHEVTKDLPAARSIAAADLDGNNSTDIIAGSSPWAGGTIGQAYWYKNTQGAVPEWIAYGVDRSVADIVKITDISPVDVDRDGDIDILGADYSGGRVIWWENTGAAPDTQWIRHVVVEKYGGAVSVDVADLDNDSDWDFLAAAERTVGTGPSEKVGKRICCWKTSGGNFSLETIVSDFDGAASVCAGDLDGDGDMDVVGSACTYTGGGHNEIAWWENRDASWVKHGITLQYDKPISMVVADIDGDGDKDICGASNQSGNISWWDNEPGNGTSWVTRSVGNNGQGVYAVIAVDLDNDGDLDIASTSRRESKITWWENKRTIITPTPTNTPKDTPTHSPTHTPTDTPKYTPTHTPKDTPTYTPTDTPKYTPTHTPKDTPTYTPTHTPTDTPKYTPTGTALPSYRAEHTKLVRLVIWVTANSQGLATADVPEILGADAKNFAQVSAYRISGDKTVSIEAQVTLRTPSQGTPSVEVSTVPGSRVVFCIIYDWIKPKPFEPKTVPDERQIPDRTKPKPFGPIRNRTEDRSLK